MRHSLAPNRVTRRGMGHPLDSKQTPRQSRGCDYVHATQQSVADTIGPVPKRPVSVKRCIDDANDARREPPQWATLVERHTRYAMLVKVSRKDSETVINALIKHAHKLPEELYKSLTWDRGAEMAQHKRFTLATDILVYFCDPQNPWRRGSNENTNGLLRQYFPRQTDLSGYSQAQLNAVARRLNERP